MQFLPLYALALVVLYALCSNVTAQPAQLVPRRYGERATVSNLEELQRRGLMSRFARRVSPFGRQAEADDIQRAPSDQVALPRRSTPEGSGEGVDDTLRIARQDAELHLSLARRERKEEEGAGSHSWKSVVRDLAPRARKFARRIRHRSKWNKSGGGHTHAQAQAQAFAHASSEASISSSNGDKKHHKHLHKHGRGKHFKHGHQKDPSHPEQPAAQPPSLQAGKGSKKQPSGDMGLYSAGGNGGTVSARGYLRYHNYYRKRHAVQELSWQTKLQAAAQEAANRCKFEHTHGQWGENIYASTSDPPVSEVVGSWYNEITQYDFGSGGFSEATGHFTQIVWSDTDAVGCAKAKCSGNDLGFGSSFGEGYVVFCEYNPPGNVLGEFQQEVAAPQAASSDRAVRTKNNGSKSSSRRSSYRKSQSWHSGTT